MSQNLLAHEASPYLLQHKDNPVAWRPWGTEAFAEAARLERPILLSIGYAACHWCHVMAHESFEDSRTADEMNRLFVNIKVDREERPDVDSIYQSALALLGESGGWPLTMFLTSKGEPFWGGTYFPPEPRFGRPAFRDVLRRVAEVYRTDHGTVRKNADALLSALNSLSESQPGRAIGADLARQVAARLVEEVDPVDGGIGGAPKFPQASIFELLWRVYRSTGESRLGAAVTLTLDRMCQGGIYDHLGGGFARYSVDRAWLVPHFEKMLYDNASLIDLLTLAWPATKSALYAARVAETISWALREMRLEGGGFASSLDADSDGDEGRFYVWSEAEVDEILGAESPAFKRAYDVSASGNWEHKTILNRGHAPALGDADLEATLAACRERLWRRREGRVRPARDDKVLADWNGLMIAALANAAAVFDRAAWLVAAADAFAFVMRHMTEGGRLRHSWRAGRARHPATLDDHANLARAALALHEATADSSYLADARRLVEMADSHFWDERGGGYFFTADDTDDVLVRTKSAADHATPSGNGTMTGVLARLFYLTGEAAFRSRAEALLAAFGGDVARNSFAFANLISSATLLNDAVQIVIMAGRADARPLARAALEASLPERILQVVPPGESVAIGHPALGKTQLDGRPTAYVCRGPVCSLPITEPRALASELSRRSHA
ncbi:MAG: thioredoxin domain-containing protein [Alphaproteobacteria bacterium]